MLRCREGDLAVVIKGIHVGYFVTVKQLLGTVLVFDLECNKEMVKDNIWVVSGVPSITGGRTCKPDEYLQPIRPAPSGIKTETRKEITA